MENVLEKILQIKNLTDISVSICEPTNSNQTKAYVNSEVGRAELLAEVDDPDIISQVMAEWGDSPTVFPEPPPEPDIEAVKAAAIARTKSWVASELEKPMIWTDGKSYTVTLEKQNLLSAQLGMYMINTQMGDETPLTWNANGEPCEPWTFEDLRSLANDISAHVAPVVAKQQYAEVEIKHAATMDEINAVFHGLFGGDSV